MKLIDTDKFMKFIGALQEAGAEHISFDNLERFVNEQAVELDVEELEKYSVSNICRGRDVMVMNFAVNIAERRECWKL